jgi:type IV fimbrial biogenesis protein FimT
LRNGFTLVEMIVAVAIVAILLAVGIPSMRDLINSQRVRAAASGLYSDLTYARAEAIKRNAQVQVVRGASSWSDGWSVRFGGTDLRTQTSHSAVAYTGSAESSITYNPDGRVALLADTSFNFSAAGGGAVSMRCVVITPSGRPALLIDSDRNGNCRDG